MWQGRKQLIQCVFKSFNEIFLFLIIEKQSFRVFLFFFSLRKSKKFQSFFYFVSIHFRTKQNIKIKESGTEYELNFVLRLMNSRCVVVICGMNEKF